MPSKAQVAGTTVLITRAVFSGTPTNPQKRICGIRIKGTMLVAISEVLTMAEIKRPSAIPTIAVISTMVTCGMAQPGTAINPV